MSLFSPGKERKKNIMENTREEYRQKRRKKTRRKDYYYTFSEKGDFLGVTSLKSRSLGLGKGKK